MGKRYRELVTDVDAIDAAMARHPASGTGASGAMARAIASRGTAASRASPEEDPWPPSADHDALLGREVTGLPEGVHAVGALGSDDVLVPAGFTWRGNRYRVRAVLSRWREDRSLTPDPNATDWLGEGATGAPVGDPFAREPRPAPTGVADVQPSPTSSPPARDARPANLQGRGTGVPARQEPSRRTRPSPPTSGGSPSVNQPTDDPVRPARPERFPGRALVEHWRVEAIGPGGVGVYELCRRGEQWRLERVWD